MYLGELVVFAGRLPAPSKARWDRRCYREKQKGQANRLPRTAILRQSLLPEAISLRRAVWSKGVKAEYEQTSRRMGRLR